MELMRCFILILILLPVSQLYGQNSAYSPVLTANYSAGVTAYEGNNISEAKNYFKKCIEEDSTCFEANYALAEIDYKSGHYSKSLSYANRAEKVRPFDGSLNALLGKIHYELRDFAKAETLLKRAISIGANSDENLFFLTLSLQREKKFKEALLYYERLIRNKPDKADYWMSRGQLFLEMDLYEKAIADFVEANKWAPSYAPLYTQIARTALKIGDTEKALTYIDQGLKIAGKTDKIDLYLLKGNYYRERGEFVLAQTEYDKAFELDRLSAVVLTHQSAVLIDLENYESAIEKCNAAIAADPEQNEAYFNRGIANEMIRKVDEACNDWQKAFILGSQKAAEYLNGPVCNE